MSLKNVLIPSKLYCHIDCCDSVATVQSLALSNLLLMSDTYLIPAYFFLVIGLDNLDQLVINNNQLTHIGENYFSGLPKLTTLYIDNNKIKTIHHKAFVGLEGKKCILARHLLLIFLSLVPKKIITESTDYRLFPPSNCILQWIFLEQILEVTPSNFKVCA